MLTLGACVSIKHINIWMNTSRTDKFWSKAIKAFSSISSTSCIQSASFTECLIHARALCQAKNIEMNKTRSLTSRDWRSIRKWVFNAIQWAPAPGWEEGMGINTLAARAGSTCQGRCHQGGDPGPASWIWVWLFQEGKPLSQSLSLASFFSFHQILSSVSSPSPLNESQTPIVLGFFLFHPAKPAFTLSQYLGLVINIQVQHDAFVGGGVLHCYLQKFHRKWF